MGWVEQPSGLVAPDPPGLGLVPEYDLEDLKFPMAAVLDELPLPKIPHRYWTPGPPLNQGKEGACVGFALAKCLYIRPLRTTTMAGYSGNDLGFNIYYQAKRIDNNPGEGTSLHAGMRVLNGETGWPDSVLSYRWCWDWDTMAAWLRYVGPVIIGIPWWENWDIGPTSHRPIMPPAQGQIRGYHAICVYGIDMRTNVVRFINSWDNWFGLNGRAVFTRDVLEPNLFSDIGAGCMGIVEQAT